MFQVLQKHKLKLTPAAKQPDSIGIHHAITRFTMLTTKAPSEATLSIRSRIRVASANFHTTHGIALDETQIPLLPTGQATNSWDVGGANNQADSTMTLPVQSTKPVGNGLRRNGGRIRNLLHRLLRRLLRQAPAHGHRYCAFSNGSLSCSFLKNYYTDDIFDFIFDVQRRRLLASCHARLHLSQAHTYTIFYA